MIHRVSSSAAVRAEYARGRRWLVRTALDRLQAQGPAHCVDVVLGACRQRLDQLRLCLLEYAVEFHIRRAASEPDAVKHKEERDKKIVGGIVALFDKHLAHPKARGRGRGALPGRKHGRAGGWAE